MHVSAHVTFSVLALSGLAFASPIPQNGVALTGRDSIECTCLHDNDPYCYYGDKLELDDYTAYLKKYYPATDHYILYSGNSVDQVKDFQDAGNTDYYYYNDFFDSETSANYLTQWPEMTNTADGRPCYRPDDADESSRSVSMVASGTILVFGAVEYQTKGPDSFFTTEEVGNLRNSINAGTLSQITHMIGGATSPSDVLATENANGEITYAEGQTDGTANASGSYGDCSTTEDPPTCDIPSQNADIHSE